MRVRLLTGWTVMRAVYLIAGALIVVESLGDQQWAGIIGGGYFTLMGLLGFGCAAGNCYSPAPEKESAEKDR